MQSKTLAFPPYAISCALALVLPFSNASADVVINEFAADSTDRLLQWDENDQPFVGMGPAWWANGFDHSSWKTGEMPLGWTIGSPKTDLRDEMRNRTPSLYVKTAFTATAAQASSGANLILDATFNDGIIVFVNGNEVARWNMGPVKGHAYFDQIASRGASSSGSDEQLELGVASALLSEGENVLAVQVHNETLSGSMTIDFGLELSGADLVTKGSDVSYFVGHVEPSGGLADPAIFDVEEIDNEFSDWIELHNNGDASVDLAGWSLTEERDTPKKFVFPEGTTIAAGGYLIVMADELIDVPNAQYLHANFKLSSGGEYLALFNAAGVAQTEFTDGYPRQDKFHSYGVNPSGAGYVYLSTATPGAANTGETFTGRVDAPDFDKQGGFYDAAVTVTLTSETEGASIRYTDDGTEPTLTNGMDYTAPLTIAQKADDEGTVIRARAFLTGSISSRTKTNTFLVELDERLRTSPALIYSANVERKLYKPFGVLSIEGGRYSGGNWSDRDEEDYNYVMNRGRAYERPIHAEFYFADGTPGFRSDCGVRVAASNWSRPRMTLRSTSRSPWTSSATEKPSFNLYFRTEYGNPEVSFPLNGEDYPVDDFSQFRIRAGKNDLNNPFIIDELVRRLHSDMGNVASTGVINSLWVNGELKGYYNMVERLRESFFRSHHSRDPNAQWDVLAFGNPDGNVAEGDKTAWNDMIRLLRDDQTPENWAKVRQVLDVESVCDYYLLNLYVAMWDWPHNNWAAAKERSEDGRYRLYIWDAEGGFANAGDSSVSKNLIGAMNSGNGELQQLWQRLTEWEEGRLVFADRVNKHMFNGGVLDDRDYDNSHLKVRHDGLVDEFSDLLRVVNNRNVTSTRTSAWAREDRGRRSYLLGPRRDTFRRNDLWPETTPPEFSKFGGSVPSGFALRLTNEVGSIYVTTDGSDPRGADGSPNPNAVSQGGSSVDVTYFEAGSDWKYSDDGTDLGSAWSELAFDDSAWQSGAAPLGYGGITGTDIATQVNTGRNKTTYFRKKITFADPTAVLGMTVSLHADGGAVVYVNGKEVLRDNVAEGAVSFETPAVSDGNEGVFDEFVIEPTDLVAGDNVIAVEVKNATATSGSSDMVMDMSLRGTQANPDNKPLLITSASTVKARSLRDGEWSALTEADFTVDTVAITKQSVAIGEMLYRPAVPTEAELAAGFTDNDQFEFIEIRNIGQQNIDLHGVRFSDGIAFDFSESNVRALGAGQVVVVASNVDAFRMRYGANLNAVLAGEYTGRLNNGGEKIHLIDGEGTVLHEFSYGNAEPWPVLADEGGVSLLIVDPAGDHDSAANWKASAVAGGTPGVTDGGDPATGYAAWAQSEFSAAEQANPAISGADADPDLDGLTNFAEFALGTPAKSGAAPFALPEAFIDSGKLALRVTRAPGDRGVDFAAEGSVNLLEWASAGIEMVSEAADGDGNIVTIYRDTATGTERYLRLRMTSR